MKSYAGHENEKNVYIQRKENYLKKGCQLTPQETQPCFFPLINVMIIVSGSDRITPWGEGPKILRKLNLLYWDLIVIG